MKSIFRDRAVEIMRQMHTTIPIDVAMMQVPLSTATVIDVGPIIGDIIRSIINTSVDFGDLYHAAPPTGENNLFVEFRAQDAFEPPYDVGAYGVHIVPFSIASKSVMFKNVAMPAQLKCWPQVYCMLIHKFYKNELVTAPYSVILGLDPSGYVSAPGFFNIMGELNPGIKLDAVVGELALITYSILKTFYQVNLGKSLLIRLLGEKRVYRMENKPNR